MREITWKEEFKYEFDTRINFMCSLLNINLIKSIVDLGCGDQDLRKYIPPFIEYYGVDIYKHKESTIVLNLNEKEFLNQFVDVCFCSGIFEYIYDIPHFIENIKNNCNLIIGSYNFNDEVKERNPIWVNSYSKKDFYKLFKNGKVKFKLQKEIYCGNHTIFIFTRKDYCKYINKSIKKTIKESFDMYYFHFLLKIYGKKALEKGFCKKLNAKLQQKF